MKKFPFYFILCIQACLTVMPITDRKMERIIQTDLNKNLAYDRALTWFAKNLNNSNQAVQIRDKETSRIVSNMQTECLGSSLNTAFGQRSFVTFSIEFQAKDNRARIRFENIEHYVMTPAITHADAGPWSADDLEEIKTKCLNPIVDRLLIYLKEGTKPDDF